MKSGDSLARVISRLSEISDVSILKWAPSLSEKQFLDDLTVEEIQAKYSKSTSTVRLSIRKYIRENRPQYIHFFPLKRRTFSKMSTKEIFEIYQSSSSLKERNRLRSYIKENRPSEFSLFSLNPLRDMSIEELLETYRVSNDKEERSRIRRIVRAHYRDKIDLFDEVYETIVVTRRKNQSTEELLEKFHLGSANERSDIRKWIKKNRPNELHLFVTKIRRHSEMTLDQLLERFSKADKSERQYVRDLVKKKFPEELYRFYK